MLTQAEAVPRWFTPRTSGRPTRGAVTALVADKLGQPLKKWQRKVADVVGEFDPETGLHYYNTIIITGPRQIGKTSLFLPMAVARCLYYGDRQQVLYTCQDRNHAYDKFMDDQVSIVRTSKSFTEGVDYKVREANGKERLLWLKTGSIHRISAVKNTSGHGKTLDLVNVDEAFTHQDTAIDSSFNVPMSTRARPPHFGPQMFIMSTKGAVTPYFDSKVNIGRKAVESGQRSGVFYLEYSADPKEPGFDPYDERVWWKTHPTLGDLLTIEYMRSQAVSLSEEDFCRNYLNIKPEGKQIELAIELDSWSNCKVPGSEIVNFPTIAVDLPPNEADPSSIVAAGKTADGGWLVDVVDSRPGDDWILDRLRLIRSRHGIDTVTLEQGSRSGGLVPELLTTGWRVNALSLGKVKDAAGAFRLAVEAGEVRHLGHLDLDVAVSNAGKLVRGTTGGWRFGKVVKSGPGISALVAASMSLAAAKLTEELEPVKPSVYESGRFTDLNDYM